MENYIFKIRNKKVLGTVINRGCIVDEYIAFYAKDLETAKKLRNKSMQENKGLYKFSHVGSAKSRSVIDEINGKSSHRNPKMKKLHKNLIK